MACTLDCLLVYGHEGPCQGRPPSLFDQRSEVQSLRSQLAAVEAERDALVAVVSSFADTAEAAVQEFERQRDKRGGQQVPFHGDFAGAGPSVISRLRWWAERMRAALAHQPKEK